MGGPKTHRNGPGMENQAYTRNRQFFGKKRNRLFLAQPVIPLAYIINLNWLC